MRHRNRSTPASWRPLPAQALPWRAILPAISLLALIATAQAQDAEDRPHRFESGAYSFSDELGGFRILSVTGTGTREDPFVIAQELTTATPVTMVIRTIRPIRPFDFSGMYANGFLHLQLEILNNSELPWLEFEFELQERLGKASVFGDGLSFDQRRTDTENIASRTFLSFSRAFEPYDRLLFREGKVDHLETASFLFMVSDFTPRWEFFLVQDPRIPSS